LITCKAFTDSQRFPQFLIFKNQLNGLWTPSVTTKIEQLGCYTTTALQLIFWQRMTLETFVMFSSQGKKCFKLNFFEESKSNRKEILYKGLSHQ
jgi:hypothetical protein